MPQADEEGVEDESSEDGVEEEEEQLALWAYFQAAKAYASLEPKQSLFFQRVVQACMVNDDLTDGPILNHTVEGRCVW